MESTRLQDLMELYCVPRWSTHPMTREQNVATHSYRVAILSIEIQERLSVASADATICDPELQGQILRYSLVHDGPESRTGDNPSPFKREIPEWKSIEYKVCPWALTEAEAICPEAKVIVRLADLIESWDWSMRYGAHRSDRFTGTPIHHQIDSKINQLVGSQEFWPISALQPIIRQIMWEVKQ